MVIPAEEKILSAAVDVAGMHNIDLASLAMFGYLGSFIFHHSKILVLRGGDFDCKYVSTSSARLTFSSLLSSGPNKISKADFLLLLAFLLLA